MISMPSQATVRIGGISLRVVAASDTLAFGNELNPFLSAGSCPDIEMSVAWTDHLRRFSEEPVFHSSGIWRLFHRNNEFIFDFCSPTLGSGPYKRLYTHAGFYSAQLYLSRELLVAHPDISPLEYPTDELLFTNYLAAYGLGVEVHGCGLVDAETGGHLLLGHSGAGKSTTARLWQSLRNPEILSDDRIILRIENGQLWMYGTPWHGEGQFASPGKAKLDRILILQHGERNEFTEMSRSRAAAEMFARCFPPFHSPEGLQNVMDFLDKVVNLVPCYEFHFVPDASAVRSVIEMEREPLVA